jgi:hypothetical protein
LAEPVGAKLKIKTKFPIQSLQILDVPAIPKESTSIPTSEFARALEKFCALQFYDANTNYISICFKSQEEKNEWYIALRRVQTGSEDFHDLPGGVRATTFWASRHMFLFWQSPLDSLGVAPLCVCIFRMRPKAQ